MMLPGPMTTQAVMSPGPTRLYHAVGGLLDLTDSLSERELGGFSFEDSSVMTVPMAGMLRGAYTVC